MNCQALFMCVNVGAMNTQDGKSELAKELVEIAPRLAEESEEAAAALIHAAKAVLLPTFTEDEKARMINGFVLAVQLAYQEQADRQLRRLDAVSDVPGDPE